MRTTLTIASATLCCALIGACASTTTTTAETDSSLREARMDTLPIAADGASMRVNGMSCPKCANNIERQLASLAGVETVSIDLGTGVVGVGFTPDGLHPSRAQLADAIDRTGFTLVSIDAGAGQ